MVMTPGEAKGAGRFFGWFLIISLAVATIMGFALSEWAGVSFILAIVLVGLGWTLAAWPFVWLLSRFGKRKNNR